MITVKEIEKVFSPTWDKEILRKIKCFADFIGCDAEDIEDIGIDDDGEVLTFYGDAYYLLTDDEADEKVGKYIKETVWAFNSILLLVIALMEYTRNTLLHCVAILARMSTLHL